MSFASLIRGGALAVLGSVLASCAAAPQPVPAIPPTAAPPTLIAPSAGAPTEARTVAAASLPPPSAAPAPSATSTGYDPAGWQQIVEQARSEGKVVFLGSTSTKLAQLLTDGFEAAYPGIDFEYDALPTQQMAPKVQTEVAANDAQEDVLMIGSTTALLSLIPAGAVEDMTNYLVGPNSADQAAWQGGHFHFADAEGKYDFEGVSYLHAPFIYNTNSVDPSQITSYQDLLDPKWKGKIAMLDPRTSGGGGSEMTFWYTNPQLGMDYVTRFLAQDPTFSKDNAQLIDWVGQDEYPIVIAAGDVPVADAIRKGLPIQFFPGGNMKEGAYVTPGSGTALVVHNPPHPNATKVFLDWLVSQTGAAAWSQGAGYPSLRLDVPPDGVPSFEIPQPGVQYPDTGSESSVKEEQQALSVITPLLPQ